MRREKDQELNSREDQSFKRRLRERSKRRQRQNNHRIRGYQKKGWSREFHKDRRDLGSNVAKRVKFILWTQQLACHW